MMMPNRCNTEPLDFRPITPEAKKSIQAISLKAGLRNCNCTFANLVAWQPVFDSHYCIVEDAVVLRYHIWSTSAYMIISADGIPGWLTDKLFLDAARCGESLTITALEDDRASALAARYGATATVESMRNSCDYIYLREELEALAGKNLKAKRNHCNRFIAEHPDFEYRELSPALSDECMALAQLWHDESEHENPEYGDTMSEEMNVLRRFFAHWDELGMIGGSIFVEGRMVAFTLGAAVTDDTFDVCIEKADRFVNGAFSIINQQFVKHLPPQFVYINREEDMGLAGLRKAKLSYHPHQLLSYNIVSIRTARLERCTESDSGLTVDWITRQYNFDRKEVMAWVENLHFNWMMSVKAVDMDGQVVGLLNMSDYRIEEETEQVLKDKPALAEAMGRLKSIAVFSFIVADSFRHTPLNHLMFSGLEPDLGGYDFIFVPVMHHLKTHRYWQRRGAREVYRDTQSVYYIIPLSPAAEAIVD